jgi:small subunit ribosomal protein S6
MGAAFTIREDNLLRTYETVFVLSPELAHEEVSAQVEFYKDSIVKNGGEIITCDEWGKRELAYRIGAFREAFYVLIQFKAEAGYIAELEKRYKFNELILRYVVVKIDEKRFKLKPRKDPVKRERRYERRVEEDENSFNEAMTQAVQTPSEEGVSAAETVENVLDAPEALAPTDAVAESVQELPEKES